MSTRNIRGAFTWNTDMNVSFNQNIIKSLNDSTPLYVDDYGLNAKFGIHQTGHPAGEFYGYVMNGIFQEYLDDFVIFFIDDILVYSKTKEYHERHLRAVLQHLREQKLFAKLSKCSFWQKSIGFLGHTMSDEGVSVD